MPVMKKCDKCNVYMKRGPVTVESLAGRIIVLNKFKEFTCPKCGDSEVVEVKLEKKK